MAAPTPMRALDRLRNDADLARCLRAFPRAPAEPVEPGRPGFWELAWERGVAVPVAHQLGRLADLGGQPRLQAALAIRSLSCLREALAALAAAGVEATPLKGPLLGARLYPDYTWRPTSDVDLLVRQADLGRAVAALEARGGKLERPYAERPEAHERFNHHLGVAFRGTVVEVHMRATAHFGARFPSEPLLARSAPGRVLELAVRRLDPTDELLFLAAHAASHLWLRDVLLLDLRLLAERERIDWGAAEARAREYRVWRAAGGALAAAHERCGLDLSGLSPAWRREGHTARRWAAQHLGKLVAQSTSDAVRILLAESLWVDTAPRAAWFLGERLGYGAWRRLRPTRPS